MTADVGEHRPEAAVGMTVDEAFGPQPGERLTDGGAGHPELLGEGDLAEAGRRSGSRPRGAASSVRRRRQLASTGRLHTGLYTQLRHRT